jgi:hypothetical protein
MDSLFLGYFAKQDSLSTIFQDAMARRAPDTRVEALPLAMSCWLSPPNVASG